jgi:CAAX protease family protein
MRLASSTRAAEPCRRPPWGASAVSPGLLVAAMPAARPVLGDKRSAGRDGRWTAYQAAVRIPVGTVLWKEVAFRGVLQASLRRVLPAPAAIAVTSGVFGLWHVRPTLQALRANGLAEDRRQAIAGVGAGVVVTAAGGALLSWLRERSDGLAAPMAVHPVTNSGGAVAAWAARAARAPRAPRHPRRRALSIRVTPGNDFTGR